MLNFFVLYDLISLKRFIQNNQGGSSIQSDRLNFNFLLFLRGETASNDLLYFLAQFSIVPPLKELIVTYFAVVISVHFLKHLVSLAVCHDQAHVSNNLTQFIGLQETI